MAFSVVLNINSVNLTSKLVASVPVRVRVSEGEARIATFTLNPDTGTIDPYYWIGQAVTIDYVDGSTTRIFTGIVHQPTYDITSGLTRFVCTDNLQETFETSTRSTINGLIPGYWDETIFKNPSDHWTYALQRISCYPGSFDKSANGTLRTTDWQAKVLPDYTYTDSTIIHDSLSISMAERRNIINSIKISYSSRYERLWQRELDVDWDSGIASWHNYLAHAFQLPTRTMIKEALSEYVLKTITFDDLPPSGEYFGIGWILNEYGMEQCQGMSATVAKRWKQEVTDEYTLTVKSAASVTQHGLLEIERNHSFESPKNITFENFTDYSAPTGTEVEPGNFIETNQASISNSVLTALWQAKTEILSRHRSNSVTFETPINPAIDLTHTVRVDQTKIQAKGKVSAIEQSIDLLAGSAISKITISLYLPNVSGQTNNTIAVPTSIYSDPSGLPSTLPALSTHIGHGDGVPEQDPAWLGWVSNYPHWAGLPPVPPIYKEGFAVRFPQITDASPVTNTGSQTYLIAIPQDELVIIK